MKPLVNLTSPAFPLPLSGVDTEQLIPSRFMKRSRAEGYGPVLLHDLRFASDGTPRMDFPLNDKTRLGAAILVARRNFGGGSSREAAVYALVDFGIRCVMAPSFGDIFASNAVNNGLLPAVVEPSDVEAILSVISDPGVRLTVDLEACRIAGGSRTWSFQISSDWRAKLLNGWDDLDLTLTLHKDIGAFAARHIARLPGALPVTLKD